jgi:hypothetical protein
VQQSHRIRPLSLSQTSFSTIGDRQSAFNDCTVELKKAANCARHCSIKVVVFKGKIFWMNERIGFSYEGKLRMMVGMKVTKQSHVPKYWSAPISLGIVPLK